VEGTVDFTHWLHGPVFEPLKDSGYFQRFFLDGGTVAWPNGADIAPETLYERAKYRLEDDPRFLKRIEAARQSFRDGRGVPLEEVPE